MDSDSGEQSEGEPVTTAGTEGSRQPSREGWDWEEERTGQEISCISPSCRREADPQQLGLLQGGTSDCSALGVCFRAFSSFALGHAGGTGGAFACASPLSVALAAVSVTRAVWGWGRVREI